MNSLFHSASCMLLALGCFLYAGVNLMVNGSGQFSLHLISFENPADIKWGAFCDALDLCDPYFIISSVTCGENCTIETNGTRTQTYIDNNSITFETGNLGNGLTNPVIYLFDFWNGSVNVTVKCFDSDQPQGPDDLIAQFTLFSELNPTWGLQPPVIMQKTLCTVKNTCLTLNYSASCLQHYYGTRCDVLCSPRNNITGHYTCDVNNGSKICLEGWTGVDCLVNIVQALSSSDVPFIKQTSSLINVEPSIHITTRTMDISPTATKLPGISTMTASISSTSIPKSSEAQSSVTPDVYGPILGAIIPLLLVISILGFILYRRTSIRRIIDPQAENPRQVESEAIT